MSDLRLVVIRRRIGNIAELRFFQKLSHYCKVLFIIGGQNVNKSFVDISPALASKNQVASLSFLKGNLDFLSSSDLINTLEAYSSLSYQMTKEANRRRIPILITVYETIRHHPFYYLPFWSLFTRYTLKKADKIHFVTKRAQYNFPVMLPQEKIHQIYFGIDTDKFKPAKLGEKEYDFLFVGRLSRSKGIDILLYAFKRLSVKFPKARLAIAGSGNMEDTVRTWSIKNNNIHFLGKVEYDKLPEIYRKSSILVLPSSESSIFQFKSWEEQFGFVLLEAMASGLAIIASKSGSIPEIVGTNNMLIKTNIYDLERGMIHFLTNGTLVEQIGSINRQRSIEMFDANKQAKLLYKTINAL